MGTKLVLHAGLVVAPFRNIEANAKTYAHIHPLLPPVLRVRSPSKERPAMREQRARRKQNEV